MALIEAGRAAIRERLQWIRDQAMCSALATQLAVARRAVQNGTGPRRLPRSTGSS